MVYNLLVLIRATNWRCALIDAALMAPGLVVSAVIALHLKARACVYLFDLVIV